MIRRNLGADFVGQLWRGGLSLLAVPVYASQLGMEAYGIVGVFALIQAWLPVLDGGLRASVAREVVRHDVGQRGSDWLASLLATAGAIYASLALLSFALLWVASEALASAWVGRSSLSAPDVAFAFCAMGSIVALRLLEARYSAVLMGEQRHVELNVVAIIVTTVQISGAVLISVRFGAYLTPFFGWFVATSLMSLLVYGRVAQRGGALGRWRGRPSIAVVEDVWRFSGGMLAVTFLGLVLTQVDKLLLVRLLPAFEFGAYMVAVAIAGGLAMIAVPITQSWLPRITALLAEGDEVGLRLAYHRCAQTMTCIVAPVVAVVLFFSDEIVPRVIAEAESATLIAEVLPIVMMGTALNCLVWVPAILQQAGGWVSLAIRTNLVAVAVLVPVLAVVVPRFGTVGAAYCWLGLNTGYCLVNAFFTHRRLLVGAAGRWYFRDVIGPGMAALVVAGGLHAIAGTGEGILGALVICALVGVAAMAAAVLAADVLRDDARRLANDVFGRRLEDP